MMLHTVNKSSPSHESIQSCIDCLKSGDAIILIEDGIYLGSEKLLLSIPEFGKYPIYALNNDVMARGYEKQLSNCIQLISYTEFVELTLQYSTIQAWY